MMFKSFFSVNRPETQNYVKRQSGIYGNTFKQDVDMDVIEREQSYREPQRLKFSVVTHWLNINKKLWTVFILAFATFYTWLLKLSSPFFSFLCTVNFYSQCSEGLPQESGNTSKCIWLYSGITDHSLSHSLKTLMTNPTWRTLARIILKKKNFTSH